MSLRQNTPSYFDQPPKKTLGTQIIARVSLSLGLLSLMSPFIALSGFFNALGMGLGLLLLLLSGPGASFTSVILGLITLILMQSDERTRLIALVGILTGAGGLAIFWFLLASGGSGHWGPHF